MKIRNVTLTNSCNKKVVYIYILIIIIINIIMCFLFKVTEMFYYGIRLSFS